MKVVINGCYGGFGLSEEALKLYRERSKVDGITNMEIDYGRSYRNNPVLVAIVEELGERANANYASLYIEEIDDRYDYWIEDYDGVETLHLSIREDVLRELIQKGDEEEIVNYVMERS